MKTGRMLRACIGKAALFVWAGGLAFGGEQGEDKALPQKGLAFLTSAERRRALRRIGAEREALIKEAIELVRLKTKDEAFEENNDEALVEKDNLALREKKESGIWLLGYLRAEEGVPVLIKNITYEYEFGDPFLSYDPYAGYPCVEALVKIGNPAAEAVWHDLGEAEIKVLPLYCAVLKGVWGEEICAYLVDAKLKGTLSEKARHNLTRAKKLLALAFPALEADSEEGNQPAEQKPRK